MATIKLRDSGGIGTTTLTHNDVDDNFTNLNNEVVAATADLVTESAALVTHKTAADHDSQYLLKDKGIDDSAATTAITIDVDNNVGIGKAIPEAVLHVVGNVTVEGILDGDAGDITANSFIGDGSALTGLMEVASIAETGYQVFPSGLIMQWGRKTGVTVDIVYTVTLPIEFPTALFTLHGTPNTTATSTDHETDMYSIGCKDTGSLTTFDLISQGTASGSGQTIFWQALGY
jgi:hypothetical protein